MENLLYILTENVNVNVYEVKKFDSGAIMVFLNDVEIFQLIFTFEPKIHRLPKEGITSVFSGGGDLILVINEHDTVLTTINNSYADRMQTTHHVPIHIGMRIVELIEH